MGGWIDGQIDVRVDGVWKSFRVWRLSPDKHDLMASHNQWQWTRNQVTERLLIHLWISFKKQTNKNRKHQRHQQREGGQDPSVAQPVRAGGRGNIQRDPIKISIYGSSHARNIPCFLTAEMQKQKRFPKDIFCESVSGKNSQIIVSTSYHQKQV